MSTSAWISLGSNLGDREGFLRMALDELDACGYMIRAVSSWHETSPMGGPSGQPPFLNGAVEIGLSPRGDARHLLRQMDRIEKLAGRARHVRWDARTLDVDLLMVDGEFRNDRDLQIPHLRMNWRRFVLVPLAEIAPNQIDPVTGLTIQQLRDDLDRGPLIVRLIGAKPATRSVAVHLDASLPDGVAWQAIECLGAEDRTPSGPPRLGVLLDPLARTPGLASYPLLWPENQAPQAIAHEIGVACRSREPGPT